MGLGVHGGGIETVRFLVRSGADVTVTDMKSEEALHSALDALAGLPVRYVLGRHEEQDFLSADVVVKNPAVPRHSSFLLSARRVETDISLFLAALPSPRPLLVAWTGTKGKSTTSSATHHILSRSGLPSRLGGNITVSPLSFLDALGPGEVVVLELSSFQLGDLVFARGRSKQADFPELTLDISGITSIYPDHQDYYRSMEAYVADKRTIYRGQRSDAWTIVADDHWAESFAAETPARVLRVGQTEAGIASLPWADLASGRLLTGDQELDLLSEPLLLPGAHNRRNLLMAACAAWLAGAEPARIGRAAASFRGIPHRLEFIGRLGGALVYNDTAATIPEATLNSISGFERPVHLIFGGTDKNLSFEAVARIGEKAATVHLLDGSATRQMARFLPGAFGPFDDLRTAVAAAASRAGTGEVILFSPGAASFELFRHEFHRGTVFREICLELGLEAAGPDLESQGPM